MIRNCLRFFVFVLLIYSRDVMAQTGQEDSMSTFKAFLEHAKPSVTDIGGAVAPEILNVSHFPHLPQPGDRVVIRATVKHYSSMVSYKIKKVELMVWKKDGARQIIEMQVEDADAGIYSITLPAVKEHDEIFYAALAVDSFGNAAIELAPEGLAKPEILMKDKEDGAIPPFMDVREISGAFDGDKLKLCLQLGGQPKRTMGNDVAGYAMAIFEKDVRYKPYQMESELQSGWMAGYLPVLQLRDVMPTSELFDIQSVMAGGGKKKEKRAEFENVKEKNMLCYTFNPAMIRGDYNAGLKLVGVTIAASISPLAVKMMDATHIVTVYPVSHSFKVYKIK